MLFLVFILYLSSLCSVISGQIRIPENPCKNIFSYRVNNGYYYGDIRIPYDGRDNLELSVNISMIGVYNNNINLKLTLLTPIENVRQTNQLLYRVDFPFQNILPKITQIIYNGRVYCYGPPEPVGPEGVTFLWSNLRHYITSMNYPVPPTIVQATTEPPRVPIYPTFPPSLQNNPFLNVPQSARPTTRPTTTTTTTTRRTTTSRRRTTTRRTTANQITSTQTPFTSPLRPDTDTTSPSVSVPSRNDLAQCGKTSNNIQLAIGADTTEEGEFPWLVAIYKQENITRFQFKCTGVLISKQHVITVAHCYKLYKNYLYSLEDMVVILGAANLETWASNAFSAGVMEDSVHPNYGSRPDGDLAILKLKQTVQFTSKILPICMFDSLLDSTSDKVGIAAGWDLDQPNVTPKQSKLRMQIVPTETCKPDDRMNIVTDLTFCGGNRDGTGSCSNGIAMMVVRNGRWFLKGLLSFGINIKCNLNDYFVFADTTKTLDWIKSIIM